MNGFDSATLKLGWAHDHLARFNSELAAFLDVNPYRSVVERHPQEPIDVLRVQVVGRPSFPPRLSLIIGDYVYCLRSAIDHVVWGLSTVTTRNRLKIEFPIFDTSTKFKAESPKKIGTLKPKTRDVIESLQPYNGWNGVDSHALWRIYWLCNSDKHRVLSLMALGLYYTGMGSHLVGPSTFFMPFQDGLTTDPIVPVPSGGSMALYNMPQRNLDVRPSIGIVPAEGPTVPIDEMHGLHDFVRDEVIPKIRAST
jgi:hypothetical protein